MKVELCKKSLERLTTDIASLLSSLRDREHTPVLRDCLNRCQRCEAGVLVAAVDGLPIGAGTIDHLLGELDALAAEDE